MENTITKIGIKNILKQDKEPLINEEINFYLKLLRVPLISD